MAKRLLVVLCVLALLCQSVAMAEDITTPSDLPLVCEACGGEAKLSYVRDADGSHVAMYPHGVVSEKSRHYETGAAGFISVSNTEHAILCYCGLVNETMTAAIVATGQSRHVASCTNPGVCAYCGATGVTFAGVQHKSNLKWEHDDTSHWFVCQDCGEKYNQSTHEASCDQPTVCHVCGAEGVIFDGVAHEDEDGVYDHDETKHWWVCTKCGEITYESEHFAYCDNPTVCAECGAEDVTMDYVYHNWPGKYEYEYDATKHCLRLQ